MGVKMQDVFPQLSGISAEVFPRLWLPAFNRGSEPRPYGNLPEGRTDCDPAGSPRMTYRTTMKNEPMKKDSAVKKYSMAEKWELICKIANDHFDAKPADYPDEEKLKAMAKIRSCSVMDLLVEEADRDIALGRGYPMPCDDD
jgi:hypothetical protein